MNRYDPVIYGDEAVVDDGPYVKYEDHKQRIDSIIADRDYWEKMARTPAEGDPFADAVALLREWGTAYGDPRFPKSDYGERIRLFLEQVDSRSQRRGEQ